MLRFIKTESFKKLDNFSAEFTDGTNLVLGDNGKGKTTIFNAVRFALFGTSAIASNAENIPTWGEKNCKVVLGFEDFLVVRTLNDCKVYKESDEGDLVQRDDLKVAQGNKPCSLWIADKLGIDYKMFSIFNMSMQGETGALITLGATELNRIVESYSGVGVLDKVIKSLSKEVSQLEGALGTVEYVETSEMKDNLEGLKTKQNVLKSCLSDLTSQQTLKVSEKSELFNKFSKMVEFNESVDESVSKKTTLEANLSNFTKKQEELLSKQSELGSEVKLELLSNELNELVNQLDEFNRDSSTHSNLETKLENHRNNRELYLSNSEKESEALENSKKLKDRISFARTRSETLVGEVNSAKMAMSEHFGNMSELKQKLKSGVCPKCDRPIENFDPEPIEVELAEVEQSYKVSTELRDEKLSKLSEANTQVKQLEDELNSLPNYGEGNSDKAEKELQSIRALELEIDRLENKWSDFDDETSKERANNLRNTIGKQSEVNKQIVDTNNQLKSVAESINLTQFEVSNIEIPEKLDTSEMTDKLESLEQDIAHLNNRCNHLKDQLSELGQKVIYSQNELNSAVKSNERYEEYGTGIDKAKRLSKYLKQSRSDYMEGVWNLILGVASEFINRTTEGWITKVGRNKKGDFTFIEDGIEAPAYSEASGAQKEFIGVAIRIGLSACLKGERSMMMLDEPTAGMREDNADKLASGLLGVNGQKVIITHRQSERLTAANIINL